MASEVEPSLVFAVKKQRVAPLRCSYGRHDISLKNWIRQRGNRSSTLSPARRVIVRRFAVDGAQWFTCTGTAAAVPAGGLGHPVCVAGQEQGLVALDRQIALLEGVVHLACGKQGALDQFAAGARIGAHRVKASAASSKRCCPRRAFPRKKAAMAGSGSGYFFSL